VSIRVEVQMAGHAGNVAWVGPGDGLKHEHSIFHSAGHGAEFVERPAEGHGTGARDAAIGGPESGNPTARGGADDAAAGLATNRKADQSSGGSGARASAGTG
jgi:hypothetical protein